MAGWSSSLDHARARARDPEANDLYRLVVGLQSLALRRRKPGADETGQHAAAEAVAADEQFLVDSAPPAGEQV